MTKRGHIAKIADVRLFMREILDSFDRRFAEIHTRSTQLIRLVPESCLFSARSVCEPHQPVFSVGINVLRSAAAVEQAFGGITASLWDDPFEWTLPEYLNTAERILVYLGEVEATRQKGFLYIKSDAELTRRIPAPVELRTIVDVLLEAHLKSEQFQGQAFAVYRFLTNKHPNVD